MLEEEVGVGRRELRNWRGGEFEKMNHAGSFFNSDAFLFLIGTETNN